MAETIDVQQIKAALRRFDWLEVIEKGFIQYSQGKVVVPPVGELIFENPPGETHIKYGYIKNQDFYVIKIASGFYNNPQLGLASSQGLMLVFCQKTGVLKAVLLDEGHLTDLRTAAAGAVAAKYFAPKKIEGIGIIGTGIQGRLQLKTLQKCTPCKKVWVWDRNPTKADSYKQEMGGEFQIHIARSPAEIAMHCNLISTTTAAQKPLLMAEDIQAGTHITAVGSDTSEKQELDGVILAKADLVISDSIAQSHSRGEIFRAVEAGAITRERVVELGAAIANPKLQRTSDSEISVVDLTGVAVQDIQIATAVYQHACKKAFGDRIQDEKEGETSEQ